MLIENIEVPKGGLRIKRKDMPQIESHRVPDFIRYMKGKGVSSLKTTEKLKSLKLTQSEINKTKVQKMLGAPPEVLRKIVIVSKDNYILDGHHRIVALMNIESSFKVPVYKVAAPIRDLLKLARSYGDVKFKGIRELSSFRKYTKDAVTFNG